MFVRSFVSFVRFFVRLFVRLIKSASNIEIIQPTRQTSNEKSVNKEMNTLNKRMFRYNDELMMN